MFQVNDWVLLGWGGDFQFLGQIVGFKPTPASKTGMLIIKVVESGNEWARLAEEVMAIDLIPYDELAIYLSRLYPKSAQKLAQLAKNY